MSPMPSFVGTFKQSGLYLNFSTWLVEKILFEPKNIKLWNEVHFVASKTYYGARLTNAANFLVAEMYKINY